MTLAPEQCRAARGWLDWSQEDLAKLANVSLSTVRDFEKGRRVPIANNLAAIRTALEGAGIALAFAIEGGESYACGITYSKPQEAQGNRFRLTRQSDG
jgi:transcriptional regulator with XRE-family HTH domain